MKINLFRLFLILSIVSFLLLPFLTTYLYDKEVTKDLEEFRIWDIENDIKHCMEREPLVAYDETYTYTLTFSRERCEEEVNDIRVEAKKEVKEEFSEWWNKLSPLKKLKYKYIFATLFLYWYFWIIPFVFLGLALWINNKKEKN